MNVIFLCKQAPQGRDLLRRPYGRFYHIPRFLAEQGVNVTILLLNYKNEPAVYRQQDGIHWYSESIFPWQGNYLKRLHHLIQQERPDWVVGFSDTYYGILAQAVGQHYAINSLIDAYDNYESYLSWCKPLHSAWRKALKNATALTAAGQTLADLMAHARQIPANILHMAADPSFIPLDRQTCRQQLKLPENKKMVGYTGSLHDNRGIEVLRGIAEYFQRDQEVLFITSGRKQSRVSLPHNVIQLGYLPDDAMPTLMNALDVLLVLNKDSAFGNYSYPVKLYEAMACQIPTVCSDVSGTREILAKHPAGLAAFGDINDFIEKIQAALPLGRYNYSTTTNWNSIGEQFKRILAS